MKGTSSASCKIDPKGVSLGHQTKNENPMNDSLTIMLEEANLSDMLTGFFYHVDEFYNQVSHIVDRCSPKPTFSDSEIITLTLVNQMITDSETA